MRACRFRCVRAMCDHHQTGEHILCNCFQYRDSNEWFHLSIFRDKDQIIQSKPLQHFSCLGSHIVRQAKRGNHNRNCSLALANRSSLKSQNRWSIAYQRPTVRYIMSILKRTVCKVSSINSIHFTRPVGFNIEPLSI